ncbi:hypothetical protein F751_0659 [Auxenochlorella protothecoides]|uniref:Uncharacterized protein n=1 Tax=Auxenochlorella protothecoides TaxID=3075 RepID=A0A087SQG9_AUXPR|nr:hypothetical protein F751_0659 [Auxenochlorella protothecoides]KFM27973.1 hypothetical protein F751_0659 [Auxenochlorella protothecoides]
MRAWSSPWMSSPPALAPLPTTARWQVLGMTASPPTLRVLRANTAFTCQVRATRHLRLSVRHT